MIYLFIIISILFPAIYIYYRYKKANKDDFIIGFILNPLLYLVVFSNLYLVSSSAFVQNYEVLKFFRIDSFFYNGDLNTYKSIVFFWVIFIGYVLSVDSNIKVDHEQLKVTKKQHYLISFVGVMLFFYCLYVLSIAIINVYPIRGNRVIAYNAYLELIFFPMKYGLIQNYVLLVLILIYLYEKKKFMKVVGFLLVCCLILIDYSHGGRTITMKISFGVAIVNIIKGNFRTAYIYLYLILFFALLSTIIRVVDGSNIIQLFYVLFGEFIVTRSTVDIVTNNSLSGNYYEPLLGIIRSGLPEKLSDIIGLESCFLGLRISDIAGLGIGLASNILTEAIYYYGDYYIVGALIIVLYFWILNKYYSVNNVFGLLLVVFMISSMQDLVRTSFYDYVLLYPYLFIVYFLPFVLLFYRKKIWALQDESSV